MARMEEKRYSKFFKAFGDPSRLRILALLSSKEMSVNEIAEGVGLSQPTVSRHLGILREANIVADRRDGQNVFYRLNQLIVEDCCCGFCATLKIQVAPTKKARPTKKS